MTGARERRSGVLREFLVVVGSALLVAFAIKSLLAQAFYIPSASMEPQLQIGDRIVVSKVAYRLHHPRRGDIVVFDSPFPEVVPEEPDPLVVRAVRALAHAVGVSAPSAKDYVKRVLALPGEVVEGRAGKVWVDGREVVEPYLPAGVTTPDFPASSVPKGSLWVMGDNRSNSADSRVFGPIRESTLVGRVVFRVWPVPTAAFL